MSDVSREGIPGSLRELQLRFLADLDDGGGRAARRRRATFAEPPRGTVEDRWAVYRDGYVARIAEALQDDFRAVRRVLGEAAFGALTERYVVACPPRSFDLGQAGSRLAAFLVTDPLTERLPFLPDLARLEWAQARAFTAADAAPLAWSDLASIGPNAVADLELRLLPATALIRSAWPIDDIWACRDLPDEQVSIPLEGRPVSLLVYRRRLEVRTRRLDRDERRFIEAIGTGAALASLADALAGDDANAMSLALGLFRRLVGEGLFQSAGAPRDAAAPHRKETAR